MRAVTVPPKGHHQRWPGVDSFPPSPSSSSSLMSPNLRDKILPTLGPSFPASPLRFSARKLNTSSSNFTSTSLDNLSFSSSSFNLSVTSSLLLFSFLLDRNDSLTMTAPPTKKRKASEMKFAPISIALASESGRIRGLDGLASLVDDEEVEVVFDEWETVWEDEDEEPFEQLVAAAAASAAASLAICLSIAAGSRSSPRRRRMSIRWRDCAKEMQTRRNRPCSRAWSFS